MTDAARTVVVGNSDGAAHISRTSRERFAPDAIDSISQDMARFMYFEQTDRTLDTYMMEFEMLRQKAEPRMLTGSGLPAEFVSVLCVKNVALPNNGETLALASVRNTLAPPEVSTQMRRLFGSRGHAFGQDVLVAADMDTASEEEDSQAWVA